ADRESLRRSDLSGAANTRPSAASSSWSRWPLLVEHLPAALALADAHLHAAALLVLAVLLADPRSATTGRADDHHLGHRERRREVDDAAGLDLGLAHPAGVLHRARLAVPLDEVQVLDDHALLHGIGLDDAPLLAAVLAGEHLNHVALANSHCICHFKAPLERVRRSS